MALQSATLIQPGKGVAVEPNDVYVAASGASFSTGDVVALRLNSSNMCWDTCVTPTSTDLTAGILAVCTQDIASGARGKVRVRGVVTAFTKATAGTVTNGTLLTATTSKDLEADRATYGLNQGKFVARALFTGAVGSTRTLRSVVFDGINGFGGIFGGAA